MLTFIPKDSYIINLSKFAEGDNNEEMASVIHVYEDGCYNNNMITVHIYKGNCYFTVWKNDGNHYIFDCLRHIAFEVIKQCEEKLKNKNIKPLDGNTKNILKNLLKKSHDI